MVFFFCTLRQIFQPEIILYTGRVAQTARRLKKLVIKMKCERVWSDVYLVSITKKKRLFYSPEKPCFVTSGPPKDTVSKTYGFLRR